MNLTSKNFFLNISKHMAIGLAIFLLTVFILVSCKKKVPPSDYMSFSLTQEGNEVSISEPLNYGSTYRLTIKVGNDAELPTANYDITYTPENAITKNASRSSSNVLDFTVNDGAHQTLTIIVTHKDDNSITDTLVLALKKLGAASGFQQDIENTTTVPDFDAAKSPLTREVLEPLGADVGATLEKRYVTEAGAGTKGGTTWANAWAATDLRSNINAITDASANKVYLIMIAGGTYKPTSDNNRATSFSMKNRVAIMGGFKAGGGWERTGTTIFSGNIGNSGSAENSSYHVFLNNRLTLDNSHLYGVTITGGDANGGAISYGGGMYNDYSSPVLTAVVFSGNKAASGGGIYNNYSSPVIKKSVFTGNHARVEGGGVYNFFSSPIIRNTVFSGNNADASGGGMYNGGASPVIVGAVFTRNKAHDGGGMMNNNSSREGPLILNTIFSGNTLEAGAEGVEPGVGPDIAMIVDGNNNEPIRIAGSVLGIGLAQPTNAIALFNRTGSASVDISYHHLKNTSVNLGADVTIEGLTYPPIQSGSSAINLGLYVKKSGTTYYFSDDNANWYTSLSATGGWGSSGTPPNDAEDLSATDITGKTRNDRPDAGVNEL